MSAKQGYVVTSSTTDVVEVRGIRSANRRFTLGCEFHPYVSSISPGEAGFWLLDGYYKYLFVDVDHSVITKTVDTKNRAIGILCDTVRKRVFTVEIAVEADFCSSGILVVRDYNSGSVLHTVDFRDSTPIAIAVRDTDGAVAMAFTDGSLRIISRIEYDASTESVCKTLSGTRPDSTCFACAFSHAGDILAAVYEDGVRFSSNGGQADAWISLPVGPMGVLEFSNDGKEVMVCSRSKSCAWVISTDARHGVSSINANDIKWAFYSPENGRRYIIEQAGMREVAESQIKRLIAR